MRLRTLALIGALTLALAAPALAQETPAPGAVDAGDSLFLGIGSGGFDALDYAIDLTIDPDAQTLDGVMTLQARATQALSAFNLDLATLDVSRVTVNGLPALFSQDGYELTITPASPIPNGAPFTVQITYSGTPQPLPDPDLGAVLGFNFTQTGAFVASEPAGAATWYPVNDHPSDKATYTFRLTVPEGLTAVANGVLADTQTADGWTTFTWRMNQPMASYLAMTSVGDYAIVQADPAGSVPIRNVFPTEQAEQGTRVFADQDEMLSFFADTFGPYPFDVYGALVIPQALGYALETQTMSLFERSLLEGDPYGDREETIVHELAHSWFGNAISPADWSDIWLNEGFATYASWLWFEHTGGPQALDQIVRYYYDQFSGQALVDNGVSLAEARATVRGYGAPGDPPADDLFNGSVYIRGALLLHALRVALGDDVFFDVLRTYYETYQYQSVTTDDFIAVAEAVSGKDLSAFFQSWLHDPVIPPIKALGLGPL